jgi:hypothetical protein
MARLCVLLVVAVLVGGCGGDDEDALPQGGDPVDIEPARFSAEIDHPFWPMAPGTVWIYREGEQRVEVTVTDRTRSVMGVETRVVHDLVTENGVPVEDTFDWYAQDDDGNLWYFGEDTTEYENGKPKTKEGSWEAGVDGALPGVIMPASPQVGMTYREEYYKGHAEDGASIISTDSLAKVPSGRFEHGIQTRNFSDIEPDVIEEKIYAEGVGVVLEITVSGGSDRAELLSYRES